MSVFSTHLHKIAVIILTVLTPVAVSSCVSETTGKEGNLTFSYAADDDLLDFNKPIAVGARLRLKVRDAAEEDRSPVELTMARSSDPSALEVIRFGGDTLTLEGRGDGSAEIEVEARFTDTGEIEPDAVDMRARTPDRVKLRHECRPSGETYGIYQQGTDFRVPFEMQTDDGNAIIGYGYYPVELSPAALLSLDESQQSQIWLFVQGADTAGTGQIASSVDSTALDVELVPVADFDGIERASDREVSVDQDATLFHRPTVVDVPVCQAKADFSVGNLTPDVCDASRATNIDDVADTFYTGTGWVSIEPRALGTCRYEVNYPGGNGGAGATEELSVEIVDER